MHRRRRGGTLGSTEDDPFAELREVQDRRHAQDLTPLPGEVSSLLNKVKESPILRGIGRRKLKLHANEADGDQSPLDEDLDLSTFERGKTAADPFDVKFPGRKVGTLVQAFRASAWH